MSRAVAVIRKGDYYGGDLIVTRDESLQSMGDQIEISWQAWGGYGSVKIVLLSADEARDLATALVLLADGMSE